MELKYIFNDEEYTYAPEEYALKRLAADIIADEYGMELEKAQSLLSDFDLYDSVLKAYSTDVNNYFEQDALTAYKEDKNAKNFVR